MLVSCAQKSWETASLALFFDVIHPVHGGHLVKRYYPIKSVKVIDAVCIQRVIRPTNVNNYNMTNISNSQNGAGRFNLGGCRLRSSSVWCTASCSLPTELPQRCPPLSEAHRYDDIMAASSSPCFLWTVTVIFLDQANSHFLDIFYIKPVLFPSDCFFLSLSLIKLHELGCKLTIHVCLYS